MAVTRDRLVEDLVAARRAKGLTRTEISEALGWPVNLVRSFEAGEVSPALSAVCRYALAVGVVYRFEAAPIRANVHRMRPSLWVGMCGWCPHEWTWPSWRAAMTDVEAHLQDCPGIAQARAAARGEH